MRAICLRKTLPREPSFKSKTDLDVFLAKLNAPKVGIAEFVCLGLIGVVVPALSEKHKKGYYEHHTKYGENQKSLHPHSGSHSERL